MKLLPVLIVYVILGSAAVAATVPPVEFTIKYVISAKAAAALATGKSRIRTVVIFDGEPMPAKARFADEMSGMIDMGRETVLLPAGATTLKLTNRSVRTERMSWIKPESLRVLVNALSVEKATIPIHCDIGTLERTATIAGKTSTTQCKLVSEL